MRDPQTGSCTRAIDGEVGGQGVITSRTRGAMHTTWRSMSLVASKRPRVTLCGTPDSDVLVVPVVDGLGPLRPSRNRNPDQTSERTAHDSGGNIPRTPTEEGQLQGTVTSENYIK